MHPRIAELFDYLDQQTSAVRAAFEAVPAERRTTRSSADRWSAADVIEHLAKVDRRLAPRFASALDGAAPLAAETDASPILPAFDLARLLDRTNKLSAPEPVRPGDPDPERAWDDFAAARRELRATMARGDGLDLSTVTMPHPYFGALSLYGWIAFAGAHTARHAAQIREG